MLSFPTNQDGTKTIAEEGPSLDEQSDNIKYYMIKKY